MKILIAPDKFKGSLSARDVAENIAAGIREVRSDVDVEIVPVADGGEGTAEVISAALGGSSVRVRVHDPLGREIEAGYARIDASNLAVMEMSEAAGMRLLRPNEYDAERANTFGVGEMILGAVKKGARQIILGLGGSATNDGGFGMARALGYRFLDEDRELTDGMSELVRLTQILSPAQNPWREVKIVAAVDVKNPLLGESGATRVFGPQKGAQPNQIAVMEQALTTLAEVVAKSFGFDFRDEPGAGAAGGLGFGLMSFSGATIRSGFDVLSDAIGLQAKMKDSDIVITGEGSLDRQTLDGKAPGEVAKMARRLGKKVFAVVGRAEADEQVLALFDHVYTLSEPGLGERESIERAPELLRERGRQLAATL